ncbi:hypothetical protein LTR08_008568 [Meristemomyces frigidus]|nr:hypothetical protein LTR08_008568 [Meristemomyces frigidus]
MDGLIYAYHVPKSSAQQQYTAARLAALAEERKLRKSLSELPEHIERLERISSCESASRESGGGTTIPTGNRPAHRGESHGAMDAARANNTSSSSSSSSRSEHAHQSLLNNPFELRYGRRYLRELPYPLPVDLVELQRQNLRTLLSCQVFGRAICAPGATKKVPRKVLEIGCGSAYWSSMCHEYFSSLGHPNVSFTGLDVAPLAPDLKKQGIDWTFVQHDVRRLPLPFDDEAFDLVMLKDLSLALPLGVPFQEFLDEAIRTLRAEGTLEIWESDHVLRSLLPHPPPPPSREPQDRETANRTATFLIAPGTPFVPAQNKYLQHANTWISEALNRRSLPPLPCAGMAQVLYQETEFLKGVGIRRVAIPLGELRWERESVKSAHDSPMSNKGKARLSDNPLTADQAALRQTALITVLQMIESLEPLLKEVSGKNTEEWSHWWASLMVDLMDPTRGALTGECLEVGAWWATKLSGQ